MSRGDREQIPREERSKRQERADRILDAALELFSRWGYNKTTVDDIARQAGVAKGTIYLHWKTREALFEALLLRESLSTIVEFRQRMDNDPEGARFSSLTRHIVFIVLNNPLFRAMLLRDTEMLGDLTRLSRGQHIMQFRMEMALTYLELLRKNCMLRNDMNLDRQLKMMVAIYMGFFAAGQYLPTGLHFLQGELAETLAETVHRTFEPEEPPAPEALMEVTQALNRLLDQLTDVIESTYKEIE